VEPTALGERLIPMLAELVAHANAIATRIDSGTAESTLRLGNVEWTPVGLRQSVVAALPATQVRTETLDSPAAAVAAVGRGQLDAAVAGDVGADLLAAEEGAELTAMTVVSEPVWVAVPRGDQREHLGPAALRSLRWVRRARTHAFYDVEERFFRTVLGAEPETVHWAAGHAEAMSWVRDAGVAALATATAASPDVDLVSPVTDPPYGKLVLVWRRDAVDLQRIRVVVQTLRDYYCEYVKAFPRYCAWLQANPGETPTLDGLLAER
jgi:hypothetical protein